MVSNNKEKTLKKELGLFEVFSIAAGAMISSGLFVLPGLAYAKTGSSVIISYLLASLLIIPTLLSKAELATAMPKAGGDYFFIDRSLGAAIGTVGGFASWFSLAAKTAFALIGIGAFIQLFNPGLTDIQLKLIAVFFCIIFTFLNIYGVKHVGKTQVLLVTGLILILVIYIGIGFFFIDTTLYQPVITDGIGPIFATAGFVFVSFMGLTKVCSVAEEVCRPKRNIPLGIFLAWGIVSALYILVIFVTVGVLDHNTLTSTLMPISKGAEVFLGEFGLIVLGIAAVLAFITTANAGLLSSSRYPMALSKDHLLPKMFSKLTKNGTPIFSILFTAGFMISIIVLLDLNSLVKIASTLVLLLFIFVNLSLIIMRESNLRFYKPSFRSPFYPWVQIIGIVGYSFLIFGMGITQLVFVGLFISAGFGWYWLYARDRIWREYSLLHVIDRLRKGKTTSSLLENELQEILIKRDDVSETRFQEMVESCNIIDVEKYESPEKFLHLIAETLSDKLEINEKKLYALLHGRRKDSNVLVHPGIAIFSHVISGDDKFEILIVRSKKGISIAEGIDPIHAFFSIVATPDQQSFYLHVLMWFSQIAEHSDFEEEWIQAKDIMELRTLILKVWQKRNMF